MEQQLSIFNDNDEITLLKNELAQVKASADAVRKSLFARHNELAKMYLELKAEMENQGWNGYKQLQLSVR